MAVMATLETLKRGLRLRMGEPLQGIWGEFRYQDQAEGQTTDELAIALNEGQDFYARDLYEADASYPWITNYEEMPVIAGVDRYSLPDDFVAFTEIRHHKYSQSYLLTPANFKDIGGRFQTNWRTSIYTNYQVRGMDSKILDRGIAGESSSTRLLNQYGNFSDVRIGDIVQNLTDQSQGRVAGFDAGALTVEDLHGGRSNAFRKGDNYQIITRERVRWTLLVYPEQSESRVDVARGPDEIFSLNEDEVVNNLMIRIDALPDDFDDDEVITVSVTNADTGELASSNPQSVGAIENVMIGWNNIPILPFQLQEGVNYQIHALNEDKQYGLVFQEFSMQGPSNQMLRFSYYRTPAEMIYDDSFCEMPGEFLSGLYARAKMILHEKFNKHGVSPELRNDYEIELNKVSENLLMRQEDGAFEIDEDTGHQQDYSPGRYRWSRSIGE